MSTRGLAMVVAVAGTLAGARCTVTRTFNTPFDGGADAPMMCVRGTPSVELANMSATCAGDFAARTFRFALCSCTDIDSGAGFRTDSYDSTVGAYTSSSTTAGGGPVGINGNVSIRAGAEVQGTLIVAGMGPSIIGDSETIHGDLKTAGDLVVGKTVLVVRNAWVHGGITAPDGVSIAGNLVQPPGAALPAGLALGGMHVANDFAVEPPCACDTGRADILAAVMNARAENNNEVAALAPGYLADPHPTGPVNLPCGRYYVDEVWGTAPIKLVIEGHVVLFVGGNFTAWEGLGLAFDKDAELDVFVGGNFSLGTAKMLGQPLNAGALRFYAAGANTSLGSATTFYGNLYAPTATVDAQNIEIFGSLVAGGVSSTDSVSIHFDRSVLQSGADCSVDRVPPPCATCSDCDGTDGCVAGRCGGCEQDSDCCDPLVCVANRCVSLVFDANPG